MGFFFLCLLLIWGLTPSSKPEPILLSPAHSAIFSIKRIDGKKQNGVPKNHKRAQNMSHLGGLPLPRVKPQLNQNAANYLVDSDPKPRANKPHVHHIDQKPT